MDSVKYHRLLLRQLKRFELNDQVIEQITPLLQEINKTYNHFENELQISDQQNTKMISKLALGNQNLQNIIDTIDSFNYHVSHDLKTSIINNIGLTRMLRKYKGQDNEDKFEEVLNRLEKNSNSGIKLIERYLEISKFESQIQEAEKQKFNIKNVVKELLEDLDLKTKIKIEVNEVDFSEIWIDEISLISMLQNFITNAYKYSRTGVSPELNITLTSDVKNNILTFTDNGIGIDLDKNLKNVFKPFVRVNPEMAEGSGVGLFIIKKIITNIGGKIEVESELNKGTSFIIKIPKT